MNYINHITISTGHIARTSRADVGDDVIDLLAPWLNKMINTGVVDPFPVDGMGNYSAKAYTHAGGLFMTVYNGDVPLVTFAVAKRSRQSKPVWDRLLKSFQHITDIKVPPVPWCAVAVHGTSILVDQEALSWLGDFERCVAWTWIENTGFTQSC